MQQGDLSDSTLELRRLGRPMSASTSDLEFAIPRAKKVNAAVRTPSGRSVRALDVLRQGFKPRQKAIAEDQDGESKWSIGFWY